MSKEEIIVALAWIITLAISFVITAAMFYMVCECSGVDIWSLKTSVGVWLTVVLINITVRAWKK